MMEQKKEYARIGDVVKIHFICKLADGSIIESSIGREPLEFTIGEGQVNSSLEYSVVGMILGESKSIEIPATKAFGPHIKELVYTIKRESLPDNLIIQVGLPIKFHRNNGQISEGVVADVSESNLTIDANHSLAGKDLFFDIDLLEIAKHGSMPAEKCNSLGIDLYNKGKLDEAMICYQEAIKLNPELAAAYNNIGCVYEKKGQFDDAALFYKKAIQINPNASDTYYNLGNSLKEQGNLREALEAYNKAFASDNSNIKARWAHCMSQIPVLYSDQSSIELSRKKYSEELRDLVESIPLKTRSDVENAALAVGAHTPFYLAYQGFNDRDLQKVYGNLVCHVMALRYPEHANRPTMPPLLADKAMKVGFVSAFFFRHASWKFPTKGWVENIDKCGFSLHGYYTGNIKDEETAVARRYFSRFIEDIYQVDKLSEIIRNDNLHILIYPEIGMDPITVRLAALRLAPIQCVSWGHAATSGFPTMDYFLSGEDLEPANAEEHYSECLIRLPNLSISYSPPGLPPTRMNRETFDLASGSVLYHCCQSLFKFLPKYDEIFPRIAQQVENSTFLFIRDKSIFLTEKFCSRINKAFKTFNLDPDKYVIFRDHLAPEQYYAINCLADVYLDPIGWSGCNSAFEAIEANLPIVTWPSQFMIGRISSAVLTTMGIKETVAESIDEYVEIAVKLGKDAELRNYLTERIAANKHFLYHDRTCITGLQDFFKRVVKETLL